jgi:aryl-alcohol dehydrogenase-like predicted oxidoreductase
MQYRTLGRTGVQVSTLVLGAMNFGSLGRTTQDEVTAMVDAALEGGINLIDTADMYSQGEVTSAIIGPRTVGHVHSQLAAADTVLSADVLDAIDAIDAIVAPGVDLAAQEKFDTPPALLDASLRRR